MIFRDVLHRHTYVYPNEEALVFENTRRTYKQLGSRVHRLTNALIDIGVKKGERIAVLLENCIQYMEIYFGIANAGAVIVPLNYRLNPNEMKSILQDAEAAILFLSGNFIGSFEDIKSSLRNIDHYILIDDEAPGFLNYEQMLENASANEKVVLVGENDDFCILYTSGTISLPKGVLLSHKNVVANIMNQCIELQIKPGSINLHMAPLYHSSHAHAFCHII